MEKGLSRELIALRASRELRDGMCVNLGMGLPSLVSNFLPLGEEILIQAENGILGCGQIAMDDREWDMDLINASGQPVVLVPGASIFDVATSFGMIRGRHLDISILGGMQVSEKGDLANWSLGNEPPGVGGIGGGMELATRGAKRIIVTMAHTTRTGKSRIVEECTLPLTARRAVNTIITNLAYIELIPEGLELREVAQGITPQEVQRYTEARLIISPDLKEMEL